MINIYNFNNEIKKSQHNFSLYRIRSIFESMEYIELDFLGTAKEIDPNFVELYERITGHQIKKKDQDKKVNNDIQNSG